MQLHLLKTIQCLVVHEFGSMSGKAQWSVLQLCLTVMESLGGGMCALAAVASTKAFCSFRPLLSFYVDALLIGMFRL